MVFFLWRLEQDLGETAQAGNFNKKRTVLGIKKEGLYGLLFVVPGTGTLKAFPIIINCLWLCIL